MNRRFKKVDVLKDNHSNFYLILKKMKTTFKQKFLAHKVIEEKNIYKIIYPSKIYAVEGINISNDTYIRL